MQRQGSLLSYFQKPSQRNGDDSGGSSSRGDMLRDQHLAQLTNRQKQRRNNSSMAGISCGEPLLLDVMGTDTPEKVPRPLFPSTFPADRRDEHAARPVSGILHKFVKEYGKENSQSCQKGNQDDHYSSSCNIESEETRIVAGQGVLKQQTPYRDQSSVSNSKFNINPDQGDYPQFELIPDVLGPETPATWPLVPRMKCTREEHSNIPEKHGAALSEPCKRMKLIEESFPGKKNLKEEFDNASSKFVWLNPAFIKDGSGRSPSDPLYDKRTLYIPPDALSKMSASQRQYWSIKCQYMDVLIFFKVGKFYELYEIDAEVGHKELDWKMTHSGLGKCRQVGISESGIDDAVQKLIARGYKVGRMEQLESSDQAKARGANSLIQRKLVHVFTPSTATDGNTGPDAVHLLALKEGTWDSENSATVYGFAFVDCAALKFWVGSVSDDASCAALGTLLLQVSPKEIIYEHEGLRQTTYKALKKFASIGSTAVQLTSGMPRLDFLATSEVEKVVKSEGYFKGSPIILTSEFDSQLHHNVALCALGALIFHLSRLMMDDALRNGDILPYHVYQSCLRMDCQTLVNLEIFGNNLDGRLSGTLYKHLDHCLTSSGKRLLRKWICHPLKSIEDINNRLNVVEGLTKHSGLMVIISEYLRKIPDLERLLGCIKASVGSSATLLLPFVGEQIMKRRVKVFGLLVKGLQIGMDLLRLLQGEYHGILSLLKVLNLPMLSSLGEFLNKFEVAKYQDYHAKDSDAEMLLVHVQLFLGKVAEWSQVIHALDCIDVLQAFGVAAMSSTGSMSRPVLLPANSLSSDLCQENGGAILKIKGLWHPYAVGENGGGVVPNDIHLSDDTTGNNPCALLLTGPNMGGKSTLLRATCLAVILAQLGCYVPCDMCVLTPVDVIFTRLGSMDRIMSGESTFLVECMETASVLLHATRDSLVLLDELGRGTSTFDGYAIAYAVFRHLVEKVQCRLLFATHYHPLTKEFGSHPRVNLQHMACAFRRPLSANGEKELIFLYLLEAGACPESYGLQVALMAGVPEEIVEAASLASQRIKMSITKKFKSSEARSSFSTLHEEWLKYLLGISGASCEISDEDAADTLLCLWYELKSLYGH